MKKYTFLLFLFICVTAFAQKDKTPLRSCSGIILDQKNKQLQEMIIGKWRPDLFLGANENYEKLTLKPAVNDDKYENKYGVFLEINKDYTFSSYDQGWCGNGCYLLIKGNYYFDENGKLIFQFNEFIYEGLGCQDQKRKKLYISKPFAFTKENGILVLKIEK